MPVMNIVISTLLITSFLVYFVPVERLVKKLLDIEIDRTVFPILLLLIVAGVLTYISGVTGFLYLVMSIFCLWALAFGFLVDRKYIYILAIVSLILCPFLLIAKLDKIAEFFAILCYLCLALGIIKDIFYEKVINE
jgi:hypothetical protein